MAALGVKGNQPPHTLQPSPLADGIHLRWAFSQESGFPWYGYYLFRRQHRVAQAVRVMELLRELHRERGAWGPPALGIAVPGTGAFASDRVLAFTDLFPPQDSPELDLADRSYLRFNLPPQRFAYRADVKIGFRAVPDDGGGGGNVPVQTCVGFEDEPIGEQANPFTKLRTQFSVLDANGQLLPHARIVESNRLVGLDCGEQLSIRLPCHATSLEFVFSCSTPGSVVEGKDHTGKTTDRVYLKPTQGRKELFRLRGRDITDIVVRSAQGKTLLHRICFVCTGGGGGGGQPRPSIAVRALYGQTPIQEIRIFGNAGQVVEATLRSDAITAVEFSSGPTVLVDLCYYATDPAGGWEPVPDFLYPLTLPVQHPNYPCNARPVSEPASRHEARSRIRYDDPSHWVSDPPAVRDEPFRELHEILVKLVRGGPGGPAMHDVCAQQVAGAADQPDPAVHDPSLRSFRYLDWLLLSATHPSVAQMLGLYWVDRQVQEGHCYDYLLVADHVNLFAGRMETALRWANQPGHDCSQVDEWVCPEVRLEADAGLAAPGQVEAFVLPGAGLSADGGQAEAVAPAGSVGLRWRLPVVQHDDDVSTLPPGSPVMYYVWRADLGNRGASFPDVEPLLDAYKPVGKEPIMIGIHVSGADPEKRPKDWPPQEIYAMDAAVAEGWYSYRVSAVDVFGRHSRLSASAMWQQWSPVPELRPWYFREPLNQPVHRFAVGVLDKMPPPPPTAVEAFAMDPRDPMLLRDTRYEQWRAALPAGERDALVGLRVRWRWTVPLQRQAPDAKEFRIYLESGRFNKRYGRITSVQSASETVSIVTTSIAREGRAGFLDQAVLQSEGNLFRIIVTLEGSPLRVHVANCGPKKTIQPRQGAPCTLVIPARCSDWYRDTGPRESWERRYHVVGVNDHVAEGIECIRTKGNRPLAGGLATVAGDRVSLPGADLENVRPGVDWVFLATDTRARMYLIRAKNDAARFVNVVGQPSLARSPSYWQIGMPYRQYDVLLPRPDAADLTSVLPEPDLAEPALYAQVGVTTADDKEHTSDHSSWNGTPWGGRCGNESRVAGPVEIFRIRRRLPDPPRVPPAYSERVYASAADYYGKSLYAYDWTAQPNLFAHVFRASDESVFESDWRERPRVALSADTPGVFPNEAEEERWTKPKRDEVAAELNRLSDFPKTDEGKAEAMAYYRGLSDDALRVLAGLPGTERAFQQLTIRPLDPGDQVNQRPTYVDTLDGRSTNRYLYRSAYVDRVHNRSGLSLSTSPVWLPNVVPPRMPVITGTVLQDGAVTLRWASNREAGMAEYHVYRTDRENRARDVRLMILVKSIGIEEPVPGNRPEAVEWTDSDVVGGRTYWYRLEAADTRQNRSTPTEPVKVVAVDTRPPAPPRWKAPNWVLVQDDGTEEPWPANGVIPAGYRPALRLTWETALPNPVFLITRRVRDETDWRPLVLPEDSPRIGPPFAHRDEDVSPSRNYEYRIKVQSLAGVWSSGFRLLRVARP